MATEHARHDGPDEPGVMMLKHPTKEHWPQYPIIILGLWLIASPFTFGYQSTVMMWSDIASGVLLIGLAIGVFIFRSGWANYANAFVGLWLLFTPHRLLSTDSRRLP